MTRPIIPHAVVLSLLLAGCVASTESHLAAHPETPPHIAASMRSRDVVEGMTREQVRLVWGVPDSKAGWAEGDSWAYRRSVHQGAPRTPSNWGDPFKSATNPPQDQAASILPLTTDGRPRRMVYFRGNQVVLVEKSANEL